MKPTKLPTLKRRIFTRAVTSKLVALAVTYLIAIVVIYLDCVVWRP